MTLELPLRFAFMTSVDLLRRYTPVLQQSASTGITMLYRPEFATASNVKTKATALATLGREHNLSVVARQISVAVVTSTSDEASAFLLTSSWRSLAIP